MTEEDFRKMPDLSMVSFILPLFTALAIWSGPHGLLGWLLFLALILWTVVGAFCTFLIVFVSSSVADEPPPEPGAMSCSIYSSMVWCFNFAGFYLAGWHVATVLCGVNLVFLILTSSFIRGRNRAAKAA